MTLPASRAHTIEQLRAVVGAGRASTGRLACASPALDAWLGGWPSPGLAEITGAPGSGRLALVMPAMLALLRAGRPVVVVDPGQAFHPPGFGEAPLGSLVLVRPPPEQAAWAAEQVARSGAVDAMVILDPPSLGRGGLRVARAAEGGRTVVWLVAGAPEADVPAALRLRADGWEGASLRVTCTKGAGREGTRLLPLG